MPSVAPTCPRLPSHSLRLVTGLLPSKGRLIHAPARPGRFTPGACESAGGIPGWRHSSSLVTSCALGTTAGRPKGVARPGMCRS
jgi:hypothetical protein